MTYVCRCSAKGKPAKEEAPAELPEEHGDHEGLVAKDEQGELGGGEIDDLRTARAFARRGRAFFFFSIISASVRVRVHTVG